MIIIIIKITIRVFLCACFISIYRMLYGLHCGRQVHLALWTARTTRRTRTGRRLTWPLARFFQNLQKWSKSVQKCPTVVQIHNSSVFLLLPIFWISFGPLWTLLEKNGLKVMSASSLVLSSLLFLPSTVHLLATVYSAQYPIDTVETGTQEHSYANFYNHYYHYYYCYY